jgi:SpoIID/LytB domain protein/MYXO-CTERM domain-containing protein
MSARRLAALAAAVAAAATLPVVPAMGQPTRLRITAPPGASLLVRGEYPPVESSCVDPEQPVLHSRYRGTVEIVRRDDGSLSLIGELGFEDYVKGIAEVPREWPMEALKAQVVAARTYALNRLQSADPGGDYDLCATTACQVYVGMKVEAGPWGDRWIRAVDQTAGQVLLYEGRPAVTYYSSTSPGRTFDVEDVFGGEALPYLRGNEEPDDGASPLSHWRVDVPFDDLARFLSSDGLWPGGPIRRVSATEGRIRVAGDRGVTLSKDSLRDALNEWAECLAPDRYPRFEPDGYQLPQTVPSIWYRAEQDGEALVLTGRGWGHGIGMVQWGAYGKAKRGSSYADILAAYYGGLQPQPVELPGTIRILIAEGLRRITLEPSADVQTNPSVAPGPPWSLTGGGRLRVRHGRPPPPMLQLTELRLPPRAVAGEPYPVRLTASDDVEVRLEFLTGGEVRGRTASRALEEGASRLRLPAPPLPPGVYEVRLTATDGVDTIIDVNESVRLAGEAPTQSPAEAAPPPVTEAAEPSGGSPDAGPAVWIGGALALVLLVLLVLTARRRKGLHRA